MAPKGLARERLLVEAAQKDPRRFVDLYEENFERVYAYVVRRVRDRSDAEDVTSDVFHRALAGLTDFEWRGKRFAAWLYRIAANAIADRWKRVAKEHGGVSADDPPATSASADPENVEERARLFQLVANLPADQRCVIEMRFVEEKSIREIAAELRRSAGAVKQLQFRAVHNLRAQLEGKTKRKRDRK